MYEAFFGLNRLPFPSEASVGHYFPAATIEAARQTLCRCVLRGEGIGLVVGPSGTGKTLLCRALATEFNDKMAVATLTRGTLTSRRALYQSLLFELGRPYRDMDEGELRLALIDYCTRHDDGPEGLLLLIDDAHRVPLRLVEELRLLGNMVRRDDQPQLRVVLLGGPALEERLAHPKLEAFSQRIVARCYLEALNRCETADYVKFQFRQAGDADQKTIPDEACKAVYQATDGVPRLINQLCDHALLLAYAAGHRQLTAGAVAEAWADLQQLPTPLSDDRDESCGENSIIEFGGLEDDEVDLEIGTPTDDGAVDADSGEVDEPADTVPALRVNDFDDADAASRLEFIEQGLSDVQRDFAAEGPCEAEVEFGVVGEANPFDESFECEETVCDRPSRTKPQPGSPALEQAEPVTSNVETPPTTREPASQVEHNEPPTDAPPADELAQAADAPVDDGDLELRWLAAEQENVQNRQAPAEKEANAPLQSSDVEPDADFAIRGFPGDDDPDLGLFGAETGNAEADGPAADGSISDSDEQVTLELDLGETQAASADDAEPPCASQAESADPGEAEAVIVPNPRAVEEALFGNRPGARIAVEEDGDSDKVLSGNERADSEDSAAEGRASIPLRPQGQYRRLFAQLRRNG